MVYGADGVLRSIVRRAHDVVAVTQDELDQLLETRLAATEGDEPRRRLREQFNSTSSSSTVPALADVMIDELGNIWVMEYDWLLVQPRR